MPPESAQLRALGSGRILPLILRYAWPALVTMSLNVLYNIVDRVYIGQGCGMEAIAGLSLTAPIAFALGAVGVFIGAGSSAVLSIKLAGHVLLAELDRAPCSRSSSARRT